MLINATSKSAEAITESIARFGIKLCGWIIQAQSERYKILSPEI